MEVKRIFGRCENQRKVLEKRRSAVGRFRQFPVAGQRVIPPFPQLAGIDLNFAGGCVEAFLLIPSVLSVSFQHSKFLEFFIGDAGRVKDGIEAFSRILPEIGSVSEALP
jgi:hypothetical protein